MINIKVKRLNDRAVIPFKIYKEDFCYDIIATSCEEVAPNVYKYGTGLAFEVDRKSKYVGLNIAIDFRPRSSIWKSGMLLSNSEGTIDESYRGELFAVFYHVMPELPKYEIGDRIGQIKIGLTEPINFITVEELSETKRGDNGYGSTGK